MDTGALTIKQNPDGGWPYMRGQSCTEPTVYAIMAMLAAGESASAARGLTWLTRTQRQDGGWPVQPAVDQSSWVTALVALLPPEQLGSAAHARAIRWLVGSVGQESRFFLRFREWLLGITPLLDEKTAGWPWVPGTAAWVGPTSLAIMALEREDRRCQAAGLRARIDAGRMFLLARVCSKGGWNYGGVRAFGYESNSYPETTGMALAALRGVKSPKVELSLKVARNYLAECRSADAFNWLRLGLLAHGSLPAGACPPRELAPRTVPDIALDFAVTAVAGGSPIFWTENV
jgi:hypothetical protein